MANAPTVLFGRYRLLATLADDPVERVLRCFDTELGREVLLESPGPDLDAIPTADGDARALREARVLASLNHPCLPKINTVLHDERGPVLVLDSYSGERLATSLARSGPLEPGEVRRLACELAGAVAALHAVQAVHRDIATANVVLRGDRPALLRGFRFAKFVFPDQGQSSLGEPADGKTSSAAPRNPAPEQARGMPASARTDLFALGCVLYEAATGQHPNGARSASSPHSIAPVRSLAPQLEREVAEQIDACLALVPLARPHSAAEMARALGKADSGSWSSASVRRVALVLVVVVALVAIVLATR